MSQTTQKSAGEGSAVKARAFRLSFTSPQGSQYTIVNLYGSGSYMKGNCTSAILVKDGGRVVKAQISVMRAIEAFQKWDLPTEEITLEEAIDHLNLANTYLSDNVLLCKI